MRDLEAHGAPARTAVPALAALIVGLLYAPLFSAAQHVVADETPGGAWFEPEPCPFWSTEESAQYRVECGRLNVPESDAGGRRYRLQVAILRSHGERLLDDALVLIPGGPGGHMVRGSTAWLARHPLQDALRQHRDIVLMDPRGTGYSEPGELCPAFEGLDAGAAILRLPFDEAHSSSGANWPPAGAGSRSRASIRRSSTALPWRAISSGCAARSATTSST